MLILIFAKDRWGLEKGAVIACAHMYACVVLFVYVCVCLCVWASTLVPRRRVPLVIMIYVVGCDEWWRLAEQDVLIMHACMHVCVCVCVRVLCVRIRAWQSPCMHTQSLHTELCKHSTGRCT